MAGNDDPRAVARRSADNLALALEDVGFDVGQAFPALQVVSTGAVDVGQIRPTVATQLASVLSRAAHAGITL